METLGREEAAVEEAAAIIARGGLVAFPTETVYGLGALGLDPAALEKIFAAKERPHEDPLILHVAEPGWLEELVEEVLSDARELIKRFWPGPLTLVLSKSSKVPGLATANLSTVAVRMPASPIALALLSAVGAPLAAPSANRFSKTSPTTADHVLADLDGRIDAVLDAGPTEVGVESTVIDVRCAGSPLMLRPGGITREEIEAVLDHEVLRMEQVAAPSLSPGLLSHHYSPRARVRLFGLFRGPMPRAMLEVIRSAAAQMSGSVGVLAFDEDLSALRDLPVSVERLGSIEEPRAVARRLFAALRELDAKGSTVIFARLARPDGLGETINDRLRRAAGGKLEPTENE